MDLPLSDAMTPNACTPHCKVAPIVSGPCTSLRLDQQEMETDVTRVGLSVAEAMVVVLNLFIGIVLCRLYKLQTIWEVLKKHLQGGRGEGGVGVYAFQI